MRLSKGFKKALFIARPNRFIVIASLEGNVVEAFLPNPGRLLEILVPGAVLYVEDSPGTNRKIPRTVVAVEREGLTVPLHTHRTNAVARWLIERGLVPGLEGAVVLKKEFTVGSSRFDFLLGKGVKEVILEVKSCTLFSKNTAMFPDAVTGRGKRHLEELFSLAGKKRAGAVLFVVYNPSTRFFMPDYHTDLDFTKTLLRVREKVMIFPVAVRSRDDLMIMPEARLIDIPWGLIEEEAEDRGSYLLILRLPEDSTIEAGGLGRMRLKKGYYTYVGSARNNLTKRIERHRRLLKKKRWHIDHLRDAALFHAALPIRTADAIECELAGAVGNISGEGVAGFGSSDCRCATHLFYTPHDPLVSKDFMELLLYYRMERKLQKALMRPNYKTTPYRPHRS